MSERQRFPLDRLLSRLGVASRAEAGRMVREGLVRVHGRVVRDPQREFGLKDPVEVLRGGAWAKAEAPVAHRYAAWHKPPGVVVSARDERGRADLSNTLPPELEGCFAAGRLDMDSEGLLLLTDDGAFADAGVAPGRHAKRYRVAFDADPSGGQIAAMAAGGRLDRGIEVGPCEVRRIGPRECVFILHEGKNRQIRRLAEREGLKVTGLMREAIGEIELDGLEQGEWRWLAETEIAAISGR
ncbi:MAG: rRNA pseudouridine synthase [Acidobacteria bacterium]|nr:rRNA pseudouridine synthase [Acidobacteriota bacterium]